MVDQSEVQVLVGDQSCDITSYTATQIMCVPPQSANGTANVTVNTCDGMYSELHAWPM